MIIFIASVIAILVGILFLNYFNWEISGMLFIICGSFILITALVFITR